MQSERIASQSSDRVDIEPGRLDEKDDKVVATSATTSSAQVARSLDESPIPESQDLEAQTQQDDQKEVIGTTFWQIQQKLEAHGSTIKTVNRQNRKNALAMIAPIFTLAMLITTILAIFESFRDKALSDTEGKCPNLDFTNGFDSYCIGSSAINATICEFISDVCAAKMRTGDMGTGAGFVGIFGFVGSLFGYCQLLKHFESTNPAPSYTFTKDEVLNISSLGFNAPLPLQPSNSRVAHVVEFLSSLNKKANQSYGMFHRNSRFIMQAPDGVKAIVGEYLGADKYAMNLVHKAATKQDRCAQVARCLRCG